MDQNASTGGSWAKVRVYRLESVELVAVGVGVGHRVRRLVPVVAPQPAAGGQRPGQVAGVAVGHLPRRVVDGARAQVVEVVVEHVEGQRPAVDHRRQAARRKGRFDRLLCRARARRQRLGQFGRAVRIGRGRVEQAEGSEPLLVGLIGPGRREGLHPDPHLLEESQLGGYLGWCRDTCGRRRSAVRFEGQPGLQGPDGIQVGRAVARPAAQNRAHGRRELDDLGSPGSIGLPSRRDQQERASGGAGCPAARVGEVIRPRIDDSSFAVTRRLRRRPGRSHAIGQGLADLW